MNSFFTDLKGYLINTIPRAKAVSGGKEILCRCPFCMDSKDPRSAHFYISVGDDNTPPLYFCQKCQESGILDSKILRMFDIYDGNISSILNQHIKTIISKPGNKVYRTNSIHNIMNRYIINQSLALRKLNYINSRLGLNLGFEDVLKNKIILNLYDLLDQNNIRNLTRKQYITDLINEDFMGFLSYDNGFINMRNILKPGELPYQPLDKRYVNYNIFNNIDNSKRHYIIPTTVNVLNPNPIEIHIAEGPFDVLGIYYHLYNGDTTNRIFSSIGGRSYINLARFFVQELGLINIIFHIYVDGDVDDYEINKIAKYLEGLNLDIYIHRNLYPGEKDYGVSKDRINDYSYMISRRI